MLERVVEQLEAAPLAKELLRVNLQVFKRAGLHADQELLESAMAAEHYALDDFGALRYRWHEEGQSHER